MWLLLRCFFITIFKQFDGGSFPASGSFTRTCHQRALSEDAVAVGGALFSGTLPRERGHRRLLGLPLSLNSEFSSLQLGLPFLRHSRGTLGCELGRPGVTLCPTSRVRSPVLSHVQRLESPCFISSAQFSSCFRWAGESGSYHSVLAGSVNPGCA